jgi:hypothetical protein
LETAGEGTGAGVELAEGEPGGLILAIVQEDVPRLTGP